MRISEARHRTQRDHIAAILRAIAQRGDPPRSYMIPDTVLLGGLGYRTFEPVQGALTSLISSGGIGLIQDDSLRIELASWLDAVEELREDEITDGNIRLDVNALLFDHIPLVTLDYQRGEEGLTAPSPFQADYRAVLNSVLFENLLNFRLAKKNEILAEGYEPLTSRLDLILRRIEAGLRD